MTKVTKAMIDQAREASAARKPQYVLSRDGTPVWYGNEFECLEYIHKHHSFSLDHAIKHEGYKMERDNAPQA